MTLMNFVLDFEVYNRILNILDSFLLYFSTLPPRPPLPDAQFAPRAVGAGGSRRFQDGRTWEVNKHFEFSFGGTLRCRGVGIPYLLAYKNRLLRADDGPFGVRLKSNLLEK